MEAFGDSFKKQDSQGTTLRNEPTDSELNSLQSSLKNTHDKAHVKHNPTKSSPAPLNTFMPVDSIPHKPTLIAPRPGQFIHDYKDLSLFHKKPDLPENSSPLDLYVSKLPQWQQYLEEAFSIVYKFASASFETELQLNKNDLQLYEIMNKLNDMPLSLLATEKIITFVEEELTFLENATDSLLSKVDDLIVSNQTNKENIQLYQKSITSLHDMTERLQKLQLNLLDRLSSKSLDLQNDTSVPDALKEYSEQLVRNTDKFFNSLVAYRHSHKTAFGWKFLA